MVSEEYLKKRVANLRKTLAEDFDIYTDAEFLQAYREMEPLDIGIFVRPLRGE
jgi:hypothetical protein